jgi:hypothetical protein
MMTFDIQNNPAQALSNKYRIIWMERDPDQNILVDFVWTINFVSQLSNGSLSCQSVQARFFPFWKPRNYSRFASTAFSFSWQLLCTEISCKIMILPVLFTVRETQFIFSKIISSGKVLCVMQNKYLSIRLSSILSNAHFKIILRLFHERKIN